MTDATSKRRLILIGVPLILLAGAAQIYLKGTSSFPLSMFRSDRDRSGTKIQEVQDTLSALATERKIFLSKSMPLFLAHLERQRRMDIRFNSQAGTDQRILVYLNEGHELVVEQDMPIGTATELANGNARPVHITLIDRNRDGVLDRAQFSRGAEVPTAPDDPRDEASLGMWDMALSTAIATSGCCEVSGTLPSNKSLERTREK